MLRRGLLSRWRIGGTGPWDGVAAAASHARLSHNTRDTHHITIVLLIIKQEAGVQAEEWLHQTDGVAAAAHFCTDLMFTTYHRNFQ